MSDADALLVSIVNLFGHDWWRRQQDARVAAWYEAARTYLGLTRESPPDPTEAECMCLWIEASIAYHRDRIARRRRERW